jgi:TRAP-type transport system periplasmic protein
MRTRRMLGIFTFLAFSILLCSGVWGAAINLKLGYSSPTTSPDGKAADRFAELAAKYSTGQIKIDVYPMEQLGKATAMLENVMTGNQDIMLEDSTWCERFTPAARLSTINYAFKDRGHFRKYTHSSLYNDSVVKPMENAGIKFLDEKGNWERGPFRVMLSRKPILSMTDLKGLKLRMWDSDASRRSWEVFGVSTTVMAWTDVYLALKQGIVDAVTSPINLLYSVKFTEVAKYITKTDEFPQFFRLYMNAKRFNSLKPDLQKALIDAGNEAGDYYTGITNELANNDIEKMVREHNAVYIIINTRQFADAMIPAIRQFEKDGFLPAGLYDKVRALAD